MLLLCCTDSDFSYTFENIVFLKAKTINKFHIFGGWILQFIFYCYRVLSCASKKFYFIINNIMSSRVENYKLYH